MPAFSKYPEQGEYTEEEFRTARKAIEISPWFTSWKACPFGGWMLYIEATILRRRQNNFDPPVPIAITGE